MNNIKDDIKYSLTCFICLGKIMDPMMCPQCKKLVCSKCIKQWLDSNHDKCPNCQLQISYDKMIPLPFMNQLSEFFINEIDNDKSEIDNNKNEKKNKRENIKKMNRIIDEDDEDNEDYNKEDSNSNNDIDNNKNKYIAKSQIYPNKLNMIEVNNINNTNNNNQWSKIKRGEMCPKHKDEIIEYYCLNCNTKHCSKCLVIMSEDSKIHSGHKIISMEQKNKFKLDEIKEEIDNLSNIQDEIKEFMDNIDKDKKIIEKKEEFIKKVVDEFKDFYSKKIEKLKNDLDKKVELIKKELDKINNIRNSYEESLNNFVERDDENGFKEYKQKIKDFKNDVNLYRYPNNFAITLNPKINFYETDFIDIEINEYLENIGEKVFNIDGYEKQLHLKLNGEADDEVLINIQIELDNVEDAKDRYFAFIIFKNKNNNVTCLCLDEKMVINNILILGKTVIKSGLNLIVDNNKKCHAKIIFSTFKI